VSGLKKYLEIKKILDEDDIIRGDFESIWGRVVEGFYNFNHEEYNEIIKDFMEFYEFLTQLPDISKVREDEIKI